MATTPDPSRIDSTDKLRNLMANARRLGHMDLALQCQIRIAELAGAEYSDILEKEFWTAVNMAEEFKTLENGKTTKLSRTRQKYQRDGARKCIEDLALRDGFTDGFRILAENGRVDLTFEAVMLRHPTLFDQNKINAVKKKLESYGIDRDSIEGWINGQG